MSASLRTRAGAPPSSAAVARAAAAAALLVAAAGARAGGAAGKLAQTPPMGWRSWNQYGTQCTQKNGCLEAVARALVDTSRLVGGANASLLSLGYNTVGLDDGWQACGAGARAPNYTFHNASGFPLVNSNTYPDMRALTDYVHSLGLRAGWCVARARAGAVAPPPASASRARAGPARARQPRAPRAPHARAPAPAPPPAAGTWTTAGAPTCTATRRRATRATWTRSRRTGGTT